MDDTIFEEQRSLLFGIAYRMLGSVAEAEDAVQETYLRWREVDADSVQSPRAYLSSIVTRLSIDVLRSARKKREIYVGEWLPEPLVESGAASARESAELAESLSTAFMLMLETLSPVERAAFLLHEVFGYSHREVGEMIERSEDACRQMLRRARERIRGGKKRFDTTPEEHTRLLGTFLEATQRGDTEGLMLVLAENVELHTDHGGKALAARRIIHGPDRVARFLVGVRQRFAPSNLAVRVCNVNGMPGIVTYEGGKPVTVASAEIEDGKIVSLYTTRNPDKLARVPNLAQLQ